ncbi:MAG: diguanylate cyclase [Pseudomonadota bacterium]
MELNHINIAAHAEVLEQVRDFYCDAIELREGARPNFDRHGYWLYDQDKAVVHLIVSDRHIQPDIPPPLDHVAFTGQDNRAYAARLRQLGVAFKVNHIVDFNITQIFCRDPSGTRVEVSFPGETPAVGA